MVERARTVWLGVDGNRRLQEFNEPPKQFPIVRFENCFSRSHCLAVENCACHSHGAVPADPR